MSNPFGPGFTNNLTGLNNFFENVFFEGDLRRNHLTSIADAQRMEQEARQAFLALSSDHPARNNTSGEFVAWLREFFEEDGLFNVNFPAIAYNASPTWVHNWMTAGANASPSPANPLAFFTSDNISGMAWARFGGVQPIGNETTGHEGLWIQKGANLAQGMFITIEAMTARRLGIQFINVTREHGFNIQSELDTIRSILSRCLKF